MGAVPDLVKYKGTGIVYRCGNVDELACALEKLLQSEALRDEMGANARELISGWDVVACASAIVAASIKLRH